MTSAKARRFAPETGYVSGPVMDSSLEWREKCHWESQAEKGWRFA